jgi:hypothetical protein
MANLARKTSTSERKSMEQLHAFALNEAVQLLLNSSSFDFDEK